MLGVRWLIAKKIRSYVPQTFDETVRKPISDIDMLLLTVNCGTTNGKLVRVYKHPQCVAEITTDCFDAAVAGGFFHYINLKMHHFQSSIELYDESLSLDYGDFYMTNNGSAFTKKSLERIAFVNDLAHGFDDLGVRIPELPDKLSAISYFFRRMFTRIMVSIVRLLEK